MTTNIGWTDETWNPVTGCTKVSAGCKNCYAETIAHRFWRDDKYRPFTEVRLHPERLSIPLHWRKPRRVFVNSMSDLFHEDVPDEFIARVLLTTQKQGNPHVYQILTKRPHRMLEYMTLWHPKGGWWQHRSTGICFGKWPLPNIHLGVSCENQATADERIPLLLRTPAAVRFVSLEPLLGPIDLGRAFPCGYYCDEVVGHIDHSFWTPGIHTPIDWVIVGGESGPAHRPMNIDWLKSIVDQCRAAGVPVFVKQDCGLYPGRQGRISDEYWIKEYPQ